MVTIIFEDLDVGRAGHGLGKNDFFRATLPPTSDRPYEYPMIGRVIDFDSAWFLVAVIVGFVDGRIDFEHSGEKLEIYAKRILNKVVLSAKKGGL